MLQTCALICLCNTNDIEGDHDVCMCVCYDV